MTAGWALVTGGWGSGAAFGLAEQGASVVHNSRTQSKLDALAERLQARGGTVMGIAQDLTAAGASR